MICSPLAVAYAEDEVYWEGRSPTEPTISDKDFRLDFRNPAARSLGDLEIYDQPKDIFEGDEAVAPSAPTPVAPAPAEPAQVRPPTPIQPRSLTRPSVDASPRATGTRPRSSEIIPQPAETSPGSSQPIIQRQRGSSATEVRQSDEQRGTPVPDSLEEADRHGEKKMKWGQVDVKPTEPKSKFQWGQQ